jgi:hypothetical protein
MNNLHPNSGYVLGQLSRALNASQEHADEGVRERAQARVAQWEQVLRGMLDGNLAVGSRTPIQGVPPWVSLEVVHGGFATGNFAAGGALQAHERQLYKRLGAAADGRERAALNIYFLSERGQQDLLTMLQTGCYRVNVPEESVLLTVAWLVSHHQVDSAHSLLDQVTPFFDRLRFFPVPDERPLLPSPLVHRKTVAETAKSIEKGSTQADVERMNESLGVWLPLYDRAVDLFFQTVEGEPPSFQKEASGNVVRHANNQPVVVGGWPCKRYSSEWRNSAQAVLDDYDRLRTTHKLTKKPDHPKSNFAVLRGYLHRCVENPKGLSGRDVGTIRKIIASFISRYGIPGDTQHKQLRMNQKSAVDAPLHIDLRRVLANRLKARPNDGGLENLELVSGPISESEQVTFRIQRDVKLPSYLTRKVEQCWLTSVETLVERGVIPSGEVLAQVLPQITSQVKAAGISDGELRQLYGAVYSAFRRRRSLLLVNLESQVRFGELPWVAAIDAQRGEGLDAKDQARQAFEQLATLAVTAFPHAIFPNKLLSEFRTLASSAGVSLPIVDELAADIFMGTFTEKFLVASQISAKLLKGTLYERYYGLPFERVLRIDDVPRTERGAKTSKAFADLCVQLAGSEKDASRSVAKNGKIIEQSQILTTQNLGAVFDALGLHVALKKKLPELAEHTFTWICQQQSMKVTQWKAQLQAIKNCAYGWRQMVFYLSLLSGDEQKTFVDWAQETLSKRTQAVQERLRPALRGLAFAVAGGTLDPAGMTVSGDGRRFLGWTTERHWLLGPDTRPRISQSTPPSTGPLDAATDLAKAKPWWKVW